MEVKQAPLPSRHPWKAAPLLLVPHPQQGGEVGVVFSFAYICSHPEPGTLATAAQQTVRQSAVLEGAAWPEPAEPASAILVTQTCIKQDEKIRTVRTKVAMLTIWFFGICQHPAIFLAVCYQRLASSMFLQRMVHFLPGLPAGYKG